MLTILPLPKYNLGVNIFCELVIHLSSGPLSSLDAMCEMHRMVVESYLLYIVIALYDYCQITNTYVHILSLCSP